MFIVSAESKQPRLQPHKLSASLTDAEYQSMNQGARFAVEGASLGLPNVDFLFLAAPDGLEQAKERIQAILKRLKPDLPEGGRLAAGIFHKEMLVMPVELPTTKRVVHILVWLPSGIECLRGRQTLQYRVRIFAALDDSKLTVGVHRREVIDGVVRGEPLQSGSCLLELTLAPNNDTARANARRLAGFHLDQSIKEAGVVEKSLRDVVGWLPHWNPPKPTGSVS